MYVFTAVRQAAIAPHAERFAVAVVNLGGSATDSIDLSQRAPGIHDVQVPSTEIHLKVWFLDVLESETSRIPPCAHNLRFLVRVSATCSKS